MMMPQPESPTYTPVFPQLDPITALSVGDSLTYGTDGGLTSSYRAELSRLMKRTGQSHTWKLAMAPGTKCSYWVSRIDSLITQHDPDVIFFNSGTNDVAADNTEADYHAIISTIVARGVKVVASVISYPDMKSEVNRVRPWIDDTMHATNMAILDALMDFPQVPVADFTRIPANPEWRQTDGIHLLPRAEQAYGEYFYRAAQVIMPGWRTLDEMRVAGMCGLNGVWRDDPWLVPDVDYRVCRS